MANINSISSGPLQSLPEMKPLISPVDNTAIHVLGLHKTDFFQAQHQCLAPMPSGPVIKAAETAQTKTNSETSPATNAMSTKAQEPTAKADHESHDAKPEKVIVKHGLAMTGEHALHHGAHHLIEHGLSEGIERFVGYELAHLGELAVGTASLGGAAINGAMAGVSVVHAYHSFENGHTAAGVAYSGAAALDGGAAAMGLYSLKKGKFMLSSRAALAIGIGATVLATAGAVMDQSSSKNADSKSH